MMIDGQLKDRPIYSCEIVLIHYNTSNYHNVVEYMGCLYLFKKKCSTLVYHAALIIT